MELLVRVISTHGLHTDCWVSVDPTTALRAVTEVLRTQVGIEGELHLGSCALRPDQPVVESDLRSGAVLKEGGRGADPLLPPDTTCELRIVAGPGTGWTWPLPEGRHVLGRGGECNLRLPNADQQVSREHAEIVVEAGEVRVSDRSTNGTCLDGEALVKGEEVPVGENALLQVGRTVLSVAIPVRPGQGNIQRRPDGRTVVSRTFRQKGGTSATEVIRFPGELEPAGPGTKPAEVALMILGPLAVAAPVAIIMERASMMLISVGSSALYGANLAFRRRTERRTQEERRSRHDRQRVKAEQRLKRLSHAERDQLRQQFPDVAALAQTALRAGTRLWECRDGGPGAFVLRIGVHDRPATTVRAEGGTDDMEGTAVLSGAPATVSLADCGVLGVAGAGRSGLLRSLLLQLAVLHSPADLLLAVIAPDEGKQDWDWVRWLPHLRQPDGTSFLGSSPDAAAFVVQSLVSVLDERQRRSRDEPRAGRQLSYSPRAVLLIDDLASHAELEGLRRLADEGPQYGINIICGDDDEGRLLEQRTATVRLHAEEGVPIASVETGAVVSDLVLPELLLPVVAERAAMALAPLSVEQSVGAQGAPLPSDLRFTEIAGLSAMSPQEIKAHWDAQGDGLKPVPVGRHGAGELALDLVRHGPHAVVVGASGSGKSEFLTTLVASLAVHHSPEQLALVLVDFKGGTGLDALRPLPHTAGLVTNLDPLMAVRALNSLEAELRGRQELFNEYGEQSFDQVVRAARKRGERPPPRLLVLVDEFAVLMRDLPDLVGRLEVIALTGRSLGVHMVLATQQPFEISERILNNAGLRVVLFVEDPSTAERLLKSKAAEGIPKGFPGRACARVGEVVRTFQSARTTVRRRRGETARPVVARVETWEQPLRPVPPVDDRPPLKDTDLWALVQAAAEAHGERRRPDPVFQEPLQPLMSLEDLPVPAGAAATAVPFALEDRPNHQDQVALAFDPVDGGLLIMGGQASGRSTALRTIAAALARGFTAEDLHLHGIEAAAGQLAALEALPHTGVITRVDEPERVDRLLELLVEQAVRRVDELQRRGFANLGEQWTAEPQQRLPYQVLLIDGWEQFTREYAERDNGRVVQLLGQLVELRASAGMAVVASGLAKSLLASSSKVNSLPQRLVLPSPNLDDYLAGDIPLNLVPQGSPPGRALLPGRRTRQVGDRLVREPGVAQIAVLGGDPSGPAQRASFQELGAQRSGADLGRDGSQAAPLRIEPLPSDLPLERALQLTKPPETAGLWALVGVGGDRLEGHWVDLLEAKPFVVAGPDKSGRTTALRALVLSAVTDGATRMVVVDPRRSLSDLQEHSAVLAYYGGAETRDLSLDDIPVGDGLTVLVVDDVERSSSLVDVVMTFTRNNTHGAVVAGLTESLKEYEYRKLLSAKAGLLLHPRGPSDGELFGPRLLRNTRISLPKGRGHVTLDGDRSLVQAINAEALQA